MADGKTEDNTNLLEVKEKEETLSNPVVSETEKEIKGVKNETKDVRDEDKLEADKSIDKNPESKEAENPNEDYSKNTDVKDVESQDVATTPESESSCSKKSEAVNEPECVNEAKVQSAEVDSPKRTEHLTKSEDANTISPALEAEEKLNKILNVVHDNLDTENQTVPESMDMKKNGTKDEQTKGEITKGKEVDKGSSAKDICKEDKTTPTEVDVVRLRRESEDMELSERLEERPEVGIVGPPTAVSELINEEELRAEPALSTDQKVQDHVAEWVQNSVKAEELITAEEDDSPVHGSNQRRKRDLAEKRIRKKKNHENLVVPTRKSQRIVSNIIKKSIKW